MTLQRDRLRAFLALARPRILAMGADLDRLAQLRRLSDVRIRAFAVGRPKVSGLDLCGLLADPKTGRFDVLAAGLLRRSDLETGLEPLSDEMGALVEACLLLQVLGPDKLGSLVAEAVASLGSLAEAPPPRTAAPASPAARILAGAKELWTVPAAPLRALRLLEDADPKPDLVSAEIEKDAGVAPRFLRISAALSGGPRSPSVARAVVAIGFRATQRALALSTLLPKLAGAGEEFWSHALRTASVAALAARASKIGQPDEHWVAGLLHEAGAPLKKRYAPDAEIPSAEIGGFVLERWKFPPGVHAAARHHANSIDAIEDASLPREAVVAAAGCRLARGEGGRWTALLRLTPVQATEVAAESERRAKATLTEFLAME